jgi:hypothetical protein
MLIAGLCFCKNASLNSINLFLINYIVCSLNVLFSVTADRFQYIALNRLSFSYCIRNLKSVRYGIRRFSDNPLCY